MTYEQLNEIDEWSLEGESLHIPKKAPGDPGYNPLLDRIGYTFYDYLREVERGSSTKYEDTPEECNEFLRFMATPTIKVPGVGERFNRLWNEAKSRVEHPLEWEHWDLDSTYRMYMDEYCQKIYNSSDEEEIENLKKLLEDLAKTYDTYEKIYPIVCSELEKQPSHLELRNERLRILRNHTRSLSDVPEITFENNVLFVVKSLFSNLKGVVNLSTHLEGDLSIVTPDYIKEYIRNDCRDLKNEINEISKIIEKRLGTKNSPISTGPILHGFNNTIVSTGYDKIYLAKLAEIEAIIENGEQMKKVGLPLKRGTSKADDIVIPITYQYTNGKGEPDPWENRILETAMSVMAEGDPKSIRKGHIQPMRPIAIGRTAFLRSCLGVDKNTDVRPQIDDFIKTLGSLKERTCEVRLENLKGHTIQGIDDSSEVFSATLRYPLLDFFTGRVYRNDGSVIEEVIYLRSYPITEAKDFYSGQKKFLPSNLYETPKIMRSEMKSKTQDLADEYNLWNNPKDPPEDRYIKIQGYKTNAILKDWIMKQIVLGRSLSKNPTGQIKLNLSEMYDYLSLGADKEISKKTKGDRRKIAGQYLICLMEKGNDSPIYGFEFVKKPGKNEYEGILLSVPVSEKE